MVFDRKYTLASLFDYVQVHCGAGVASGPFTRMDLVSKPIKARHLHLKVRSTHFKLYIKKIPPVPQIHLDLDPLL